MKKYFIPFTFGIALVTTILLSSSAAAQSPAIEQPAQEAIKVASVGIEDAQIISQEGNVVTLSFTLVNEELQQTGVRYGVTLVAEQDASQIVLDDFVYEESLTLAEHSSLSKQVTYTAPSQLTGTYTVYINSKNNNGFPFAVAQAGTVALVASTKGITIDTQSCYTHLPDDAETTHRLLLAPTVLGPQSTLTLVCTVANTSDTSVTVLPTYTTKQAGAYGSSVVHQGGEVSLITLAPNEEKVISLALPRASEPQTYIVSMVLTGDKVTSNTVTAHYYVPGMVATIANATLDKDFYVKGDSAEAVILRSTNAEVVATLSIKNENGRACADTVTQNILPTDQPINRVAVPILRDCYGPQLSVVLKDADGATLDSQEYAFATTSVPKPSVPWQTAVLILVGIIILGVGAWYVRRTMHSRTDTDTAS